MNIAKEFNIYEKGVSWKPMKPPRSATVLVIYVTRFAKRGLIHAIINN